MELTEQEKNVFKNVGERFAEEPLIGIDEGLGQSYYYTENYEDFVEVAYRCAKRLLTEVAEKRGLSVNNEETFELNDMVESKLEDFNLEYYKDYDLFKKYIEIKTKNMDADEIEDFYNKLGGGIGSMQDSFRDFMTNYIPKISENLTNLFYELKEKEKTDGNEELDEEEIEILSPDDASDWSSGDDDEWFKEDYNNENESKEEKLSDEELIECIKFLNTYSKLMTYKGNGQKIVDELFEIKKSKKLSEFYDKEDFVEDFKKIMEHDKTKHNYLFHGTQDLESAESIINEGLLMMREDLSTTTYSELTMDEIILYSRGIVGEIGRDAIIIIDQPIDDKGQGKNIVKRIGENKNLSFVPSGLQGLDGKPQYIVDSRYIIGYVNKQEKEVVFNPKYYEYDKFEIKKEKIEENVTAEKKRSEFVEGLKVSDDSLGRDIEIKQESDINEITEKSGPSIDD